MSFTSRSRSLQDEPFCFRGLWAQLVEPVPIHQPPSRLLTAGRTIWDTARFDLRPPDNACTLAQNEKATSDTLFPSYERLKYYNDVKLDGENLSRVYGGAPAQARIFGVLPLGRYLRLSLLLLREGEERIHLAVSQPEPNPQQNAEIHGKQSVAEQRVLQPEIGGDGSSQISSEQDGAKD